MMNDERRLSYTLACSFTAVIFEHDIHPHPHNTSHWSGDSDDADMLLFSVLTLSDVLKF